MNEFEVGTVIKLTRELETILEEQLGAEGKGLHEKLDSVESRVPERLLKQGRFIASVRNKVAHKDSHPIPDDFCETCEGMIDEVKKLAENDQGPKKKAFVGMRAASKPVATPSSASAPVNKRVAADKKESGGKKKKWVVLAAAVAAAAFLFRR